VRFSAPNKHHFLVDLSPFGVENNGEVFIAADRLYGLIEAAVSREGASAPEMPDGCAGLRVSASDGETPRRSTSSTGSSTTRHEPPSSKLTVQRWVHDVAAARPYGPAGPPARAAPRLPR
jgi:hypothetical protein